MSHYKSNLRDIEFNLFEAPLAGVARPSAPGATEPSAAAHPVFGREPFTEVDADTARSVLTEVDRLAREDLAPSYAPSDRHPPTFDALTFSAPLPEPFKQAYRILMDSEFWRLDLPPELGGTNAPRVLWWSLAELVLGANAPLWLYGSGPSLARTLLVEGTAEQKRWAEIFVERRWGATMVLTEPDAGSDVGAGRTRAIGQPDGSWHIEGVKRFITSGEHDLSDNIIHYVLARPVGVDGAGGPGTKGLSLFVVPKVLFDPVTGELGARNGVVATNVEHKMGLKVSNTCELTFGGHGAPARGWLVGEVHDGIRQMFRIIEYARMMVGTKATATLSSGYLNALDYAKARVQGADLLRQTDKTAPRVTITHHPDVRRSLALQKAYAEGLRALICYTGSWQDGASIALASGDAAAARLADRVNDLLLPLVKGCGSERAYELLGHESLQVLGGSGYLQDYPLEQYVRDAKIDTLYEGTTAIQSLDLLFRKIMKDGGTALRLIADEVRSFLDAEGGDGELKDERQALRGALADVEAMIATVTGWVLASQSGEPAELYKVGLCSRRVLLALGDLVIGWLLQCHADVALGALGRESVNASDRAFYQGKIASARFFAREVLPRLSSDRHIVSETTLDLMELPEECF